MKRIFSFITPTMVSRACVATLSVCALAMVACTDDPTTGETPDKPTTDVEVDKIVEWMDGRLQKEYYWMEEYNDKRSTFNMSLEWDEYLDATLLKLNTNIDDGNVSNGKRYLYTYVDRKKDNSASATTRSDFPVEEGYGIELSTYVVTFSGIDKYTDGNYGFPIEHAYPASSADEEGLKRGDVIVEVNGSPITRTNYSNLWSELRAGEGSADVRVYSYDEEEEEYVFLDCTLTSKSYEENPVAFGDLLTIDSEKIDIGDKKIGYLCYLSFEADFDQKLVEAVENLIAKGATDVILDLRSNGGGHVTSSVLLASMLLDESYVGPGKVYARLKHNPNNKVYDDEEYTLQKRYTPNGASTSVDVPNLGLKKVWIICSEDSASASEMVIVGLRGLDVEVELVGNITEGKNCGMEVTSKTHDGYKYSFAPITFMNENGKGFSDYGDGIVPEHYLYEKSNSKVLKESLRSACAYYPIPITVWGDVENDIALCETVMQICGTTLFAPSAKSSSSHTLTTRAAASTMPQRTDIRMEKTDLKSRGMIVREQDIEQMRNNR